MRWNKASVLAVSLVLSAFPLLGAQRTFVASNGNDMNPCTRDLPCRSFAAAIAQTNANGEVVAIDSAGYGAVTVTQSVTIVAPLGVHAGISVFSGDGVTITAGSSDVVVLRNLYINAQGGVNGVTLTTAGSLHIESCVVSGFSSNGINLTPSTASKAAVSDTVVRQSGASGLWADGAAGLTVSVDRCRFEKNGNGLAADRATVAVFHSIANANAIHGFYAVGNDASLTPKMSIEASVSSNNGGSGVRSFTSVADVSVADSTICDNTFAGIEVAAGTARVTRNTITRNGTGLFNNIGTLRSTGDNMVDGNGTNTSGAITAANKS